MTLASSALPRRPHLAGRRRVGPDSRRPSPALAVLLTVGVLAVAGASTAGAVRIADLVRTRGEHAAVGALADPLTHGLAVGDPVRTSFGALTVRQVTLDNGLSAEDLGGMSHGVSDLVSQGSAQVNVLVTLNNTGRLPVVVQAGQFQLATEHAGRAAAVVPVTGTTLQAGPLPARSTVDARLTMITPTDGSQLWLEYTDPGSAAHLRVALGTTDLVATAPDGHAH